MLYFTLIRKEGKLSHRITSLRYQLNRIFDIYHGLVSQSIIPKGGEILQVEVHHGNTYILT